LKNVSDVKRFMHQERLASFATVDNKNRPHVVPVFFTYDNGKIYVQADRKSLKVRNLRRNSNVAVAVYYGEEAVIIRGKGLIVESENEFIKRTQQHIDKYHLKLDRQGRDSMGIPLFNSKIRCVIEVTSEKILFW
jgi:nitroimidazol reductase NimA-like FMN-containing flavoprotein (pyridoxamine 5'-phosphate oxidase superfamily)